MYNVVPPPGKPAELGFTVAGIGHIPLFFHVRSEGDYGQSAEAEQAAATPLTPLTYRPPPAA